MTEDTGTEIRIIKHSVTISGHATSISLEEPFWLALKDIAKSQKCSVNAVITKIDTENPGNLSSALRCYILEQVRND
ncbi:MAG: ribbon-helix-helix domain-containing protein [Pseudomonadota bacterium]